MFQDPENFQEIIDDLKKCNTPEEIQGYIERTCPGWLEFSLEKYSDDYPHLTANWNFICSRLGVSPQKIVLVSEIIFDENHKTIRAYAEYVTRKGYVVRRSGEFIACERCNAAIPCEKIWELLKEKNFSVPKVWKNTCSSCFSSSNK